MTLEEERPCGGTTVLRRVLYPALLTVLIGCGAESGAGLIPIVGAKDSQSDDLRTAGSISDSTVTRFPTRLLAVRGEVSADSPVQVLSRQDQEGEEDDWRKYIGFNTDDGGLRAKVYFSAPSPAASQLGDTLAVDVNYKGWNKERQEWQFHIYDFGAREWLELGDNTEAESWVWTLLSFEAEGPLDRYVNKKGEIVLRYMTKQEVGNSQIDYFAARFSSEEAGAAPNVANAGGVVAEGEGTAADKQAEQAQTTQPDDTQPEGNGTTPMFGVTIDAIDNLKEITRSLGSHGKRVTTRIVFDEYIPASEYLEAVQEIGRVSDIMGEILDSFYVKDYTVDQYRQRVEEYLGLLGDYVDIWEVGNEINGEWLGSNADVVAKMSGAFDLVKAAGKKTELTLYYNEDCWSNPSNEMLLWARNNVPQRMKDGLDYVLVSYYEDDCNDLQPDWDPVFRELAEMFPNASVGFGEVGTIHKDRKVDYITRYYNMTVDAPRFIGGYFWWYYKQDMVPMEKGAYWQTLENAIR